MRILPKCSAFYPLVYASGLMAGFDEKALEKG